jgi:hypothetical protein
VKGGPSAPPGCQSQGTYAAALSAHGRVAVEIDLTSGAGCGGNGTATCACLPAGPTTCTFDQNTTDTLTLSCGTLYAQLQRSP